MRSRSPLPVCAALAFLAACGVGRPAATAGSDAAASADGCTQCHGSGTDPAPPRSAHGETATTSLAVGAHQAHLHDGALRRAVACAECHVVPTSVAHSDGVARVTFGPTANAGGVASAWDRASATCTTYCHGASLAGGVHPSPVWTAGAGEAACGSCHGTPPPAPHPATTADCGSCHAGYTRTTVNLDTHVDGHVQVAASGGAACGSCHGLPPPAPHAQSTDCGSCHAGYTSTSTNPATHQNGVVDVAMSCTSCHGAPPSTGQHQRGAHLSRSCGDCHSGYTTTTANPSLHVNGTKDVGGAGTRIDSWNPSTRSCAPACHGSETW